MNQRIRRLEHLPGRGPVNLNASPLGLLREQTIQIRQAAIQHRFQIVLLRSMGIELEKNIPPILGARSNHRRTREAVARS